MAEEKPKQIRAIELVRNLFEAIHGNLGLLKFSLENKFFKLCEKLLPIFSEVKRSPSGRAMKKKFGSNLRTKDI